MIRQLKPAHTTRLFSNANLTVAFKPALLTGKKNRPIDGLNRSNTRCNLTPCLVDSSLGSICFSYFVLTARLRVIYLLCDWRG
ncbi:hypothetical protein J0B02_00470 [Enterobacteriaceae bacterium YMB-R22]|uniref:hypothetical protein n=1 Tax=Tenebrionicola larvae TaxID=2815733 RepID=UPI0020116E31|nr:hypothetical protein [Tenebrionicola larvae]MBV4411332.1 hypothetical protein [Tenebrionicola larvae]